MALMAARGSAFESLARQRDDRTRRHLGYVAQHNSTETEFCRADQILASTKAPFSHNNNGELRKTG